MHQAFLYTALVVVVASSVSANPVQESNPIQLPAGFQYPNGIAHTNHGTLYVGSVTSGQILRITPNGKTETFFPGTEEIFAATSLRLDERRSILWGACYAKLIQHDTSLYNVPFASCFDPGRRLLLVHRHLRIKV